jgi:hypothetical protein
MTGSAWAALQAVLATLTTRQREVYRERVAAWTRAVGVPLPDEALLLIAHAVENRTHPNGPKLRRIVAQFPSPPGGLP